MLAAHPGIDGTSKRAFLLLVIVQALHSIEEYRFALWEALAPARFLSGILSSDLPAGFAAANLVVVAFGLWSYAVPVRREHAYARGLMWFWTLLEAANGVGHLLFVLAAASYFPGAYTAPLLLVSAALLATCLLRSAETA